MSVYKNKKSPYYAYDFQFGGHRFHGSTKVKSKREAESIERDLKREARQKLRRAKVEKDGPLTLDTAAGRFWIEVGERHAGASDTWTNLDRLLSYFGPEKRLNDITDDDVARLVAWRREHTVGHGEKEKPIAPATVNRSTTKVLRALFTRAKRAWRVQFTQEPNWKVHMLKEPEERVRELHDYEADALDGAVRQDYAPWLEFARATGLRLSETLIRWSAVNWSTGQIRTRGKGGKFVMTPITPTVRAILKALEGDHPDFVFTYICERSRQCPKTGFVRVKGQRYPITKAGAKSQWRRTRARAKLEDFRFHDIRHDVATKLLRQTGNLKIVQRALNHSDVKTTVRYAHVLDEEISAALENAAQSRENSRKEIRKAS